MDFESLFMNGGTYSSKNYSPNHGVVLIGYDYRWGYNIKNSWGRSWGNGGYTWVSRYRNAGICNYGVTINMMTNLNNQKPCGYNS